MGEVSDGLDQTAAEAHAHYRPECLVDLAAQEDLQTAGWEIEAAAAKQAVEVREGDVLGVRTGWRRRFLEVGGDNWLADAPGLSWHCAQLFHSLGVAAVACDNGAVEPRNEPDGVGLTLHMLALRDMGVMLGKHWDLEELANDCANDGQYDFLLVAAALPFTGGVGSPVNPIALK